MHDQQAVHFWRAHEDSHGLCVAGPIRIADEIHWITVRPRDGQDGVESVQGGGAEHREVATILD